MKGNKSEATHGLLSAVVPAGIGEVMDCKRYSSVARLLAVTANVQKFCRLARPYSSLPAESDTAKAEILWILETQKDLVKDPKFAQWKRQFNLFQDDRSIWRSRGRIENADVSYSTKYPILLPRDHPFTALIVRRAHERVFHGGVKSTLTELRSQFWIVKGRSLIQRLLRSCVLCKRFEGRPYRHPPPPPLPLFRVDKAPPFTYTGVDFAGPLYLKGASTSPKVWICLFTCCVTRAVHLDLVRDLSTSSFIRCLKKFVARRGLPTRIVSDNGKTFKSAAKVLRSIVSSDDVQQHASGLGIQWTFNLPKAPWWGGIFERLIRSTKRCLRKIIGKAKFTFDELLTAVIEVEAVLNSRPLTSTDMEEPLTPSHLIAGRRIWSLPDHLCRVPEDEEFGSGPELLTKRARHLNRTLDRFWSRWRKEYLVELREAHRQHNGHTDQHKIAVDDVVIVHSKDDPRGFWKLGHVKQLTIGRDDKVRGAVVKVSGKGRQATSLHRPIQLLYPLEVPHPTPEESGDELETAGQDISSSSGSVPEDEPDVPPTNGEPTAGRRRSRRAAALEARDRLIAQALEGEELD